MRPDKHKKKDFLKSDHGDYDDKGVKHLKIHQIKDEDELDKLPSKGKNNLVYRGQYMSNAVDRFLRQNIGNKWDDIYSELVKRVGHNDSIKYRVELHTFELDGKIVYNGFCGTQEVSGFYVFNGILQERKKGKRIRKEKKHVTFVDGFVVFKHNDLFFKAPIKKAQDGSSTVSYLYGASPYTSFGRGDNYVKYTSLVDGKRLKNYIHSRYIRQLNSRELKNWELPDTDINVKH